MDSDATDDLLQACKNSKQKFEGYFNVSNDYCTVAILLDPRFKLDFYVDDSKTATEISDQQNEAWLQLKRMLDICHPPSSATHDLENVAEINSLDKPLIFKKLKTAEVVDELRTYLKEYPRCSHAVDPLQWWKEHHATFPRLSKLVRDFLAIPGSSVASERAFSGGISLF
jgi:hypothetical protein